MRIIAHRGVSSLAPENTMAAFVKCLDVGVDWFEFDVQMAGDASLMVIHDDSVDRTTNGVGHLEDLSFGDLRRLDAGAWFGPGFRLERLPELASVIELLNTTRLCANLEAKADITDDARRSEYLETLARALTKIEDRSKILISSFDPRMLEPFEEYPRAFLVEKGAMRADFERRLAKAVELGCVAINPEADGITETQVEAMHAAGLAVNVWTVNDRAQAEQLRDIGVDAIITDVPQEMVELLTS